MATLSTKYRREEEKPAQTPKARSSVIMVSAYLWALPSAARALFFH